MLIACPNCTTSYDLAAEAIGEGRDVRCARCEKTWFATPVLTGTALVPSAMQPPPNWPSGLRFIAPAGASSTLPAKIEQVQPVGNDLDFDVVSSNGSTGVVSEAEIPSTSLVTVEAVAPEERSAEAERARRADIESVAARQARLLRHAKHRKPKSSRLSLVVAAAAGIAVAALVLRADVVRFVPQTARLYAAIGLPVNLRGLDIADVKISGETHEGVPVLVIEGKVVSKAKQTVEVPKLRFAMRGSSGAELYAWTMQAETRVLAAGEALPFRSRLASPPGEARDVQVRFLHRRDF